MLRALPKGLNVVDFLQIIILRYFQSEFSRRVSSLCVKSCFLYCKLLVSTVWFKQKRNLFKGCVVAHGHFWEVVGAQSRESTGGHIATQTIPSQAGTVPQQGLALCSWTLSSRSSATNFAAEISSCFQPC